ncbi:hypothetical protein M3Y99_01327500 [Aphelenchoides fujianensis]|nr:hypothetical protein M3Y99_01327500 [Aphelenchoides fujianensis]
MDGIYDTAGKSRPLDVGEHRFAAAEERSRGKRRGVGEFFRKYFLEGQKLDDELERRRLEDPNLPFFERYRKYFAFLLPFLFFQVCWWSLALKYHLLELYATRWQMPVTMIFGASGATSEGGGAVAFPVMTLLLHIEPRIARDFSLMIQSCGPQKKMIFVSIWFSFAVALLILNLQRKRITYDSIPQFNAWKAAILFGTGFFGGLLSAFTGSGVDICSFSVLTLLFRVSEKVATPTSVLLMCINTWVGFYWQQLIMQAIAPLAWQYFSVSVPVVVTMSPIGAFLSSHLHRQLLAAFVYVLEVIALVGFYITRPPWELVGIGAAIIFVAILFFFGLSKVGRMLSDRIEAASSRLPSGASSEVSVLPSDFSTSIVVNRD